MLIMTYCLSSYNSIKTWMQDGNSKKALQAKDHMIGAAEAGL